MRRVQGFRWAALAVVAGASLAGCVAPAPPSPPPPSGPDLVATDIAWPTPLVVGERVAFSITVANIGDTATPPNTILDVLITLDVDTTNAADIGWSDNVRVPLAPGESRTQVVNGGPDGSDGLWAVSEGAHNVRAYVNSGSLPARPPIVESNRQNNFLLETFSVQGPPRTDQIAFVGAGGGIWTMHSDATDVHQLTSDGFQPAVSRDGQRIAYVRSFPATAPFGIPYSHIWVMNADGSDQHEVYVAPPASDCNGFCPPFVQPADTIRDDNPAWSPDGTEIAFVRHPVNLVASSVLAMHADGTAEARAISRGNSEDRFYGGTAWSPDGATFANATDYVCCNIHIGLYHPDGSGLSGPFFSARNGVDETTFDYHPNFSSDGRIAFDGRPNLDGRFDTNGPIGAPGLWVTNVADPFAHPMLLVSGDNFFPSFSPDSSRVAFSKNGTIWTMKTIPGFEGTDLVDTHVAGSDPSWGP